MGGAAEETVEQTTKKDGMEVSVGHVRFHENAGEVHFHDDANKLKVAVPVSVWHTTWNDLSCGARKQAELVDPINRTAMTVTVTGKKVGVKGIKIKLKRVELTSTFEKLQKFAMR